MTELQGDVTTLLNGRVVKSIQRGTLNSSQRSNTISGGLTFSIDISPVATDKACLINNFEVNRSSDDGIAYFTNVALNDNTIDIAISYTSGNGVTFTVSGFWQVIEFY